MNFNTENFVATFERTLKRLTNAEAINKQLLMPLSRDLLSALHMEGPKQGDITFFNRTIQALSPVNRKALIAFGMAYTGFILNDSGTMFAKKSKKHYDDVQASALQFLEDPLNNVFSWFEKEMQIGKIMNPPPASKFKVETIKESNTKLLKKADKAGISRAEFLKQVMGVGFTLNDLVECMVEMGEQDNLIYAIEVDGIKRLEKAMGQ